MLVGKRIFIYFFFIAVCIITFQFAEAQCSICTRTAQQLGEKPAQGLNAGILYLAVTPLAIVGIVAFKWIKRNRD
ncbi:MAG: hypothetical protein ACJ748_04645 [Flavisolibacter sp.]